MTPSPLVNRTCSGNPSLAFISFWTKPGLPLQAGYREHWASQIMRWSKLRDLYLDRLAPELGQRIDIHMAKYPSGGRGWITFDGIEVAAVQAPGFTRKIFGHSMCADLHGGQTLELGSAVFDLLNMTIESASKSSNPMVQGLGILEARFGKARVAAIDSGSLSSFPAAMLATRQQAMGLPRCTVLCESCGELISTDMLHSFPRSLTPHRGTSQHDA